MKVKKALAWVAFWVCMALLFNLGIYLFMPVAKGADRGQNALQFFGGYIIELTLSVDNLFVFLAIFSSFNVPAKYQRRVLNYGIAGAVILRLAFILLGVTIVSQWEGILYVFGGILIISGVLMLLKGEKEKDYKNSRIMSNMGKVIPFTGTLEQEKFFVKRNGKTFATLLFAILLIVETSDIIFAVDSIPAIFSVTQNWFIIFTSNMFAILGLRSLYFVLEKLSSMFRFMKYGVACVLLFTGIKLIVRIDDIILSIGIIAVILLASIFASILIKQKTGRDKVI